jgi:hypothetical protein
MLEHPPATPASPVLRHDLDGSGSAGVDAGMLFFVDIDRRRLRS